MASSNCPIVGTMTYPTDNPLIVGTPAVLPANCPTISLTSKPSKQVPRPSKNTEGETHFLFWSRYQQKQNFTELRHKTKIKHINTRHWEQILFLLCHDGIGFDEKAWAGASRVSNILCDLHPDFSAMILNVPKLRLVDFSSLRDPRYNYSDQTHISKIRVWLLTACAVYYNLDLGLVVRYLAGEYMAK